MSAVIFYQNYGHRFLQSLFTFIFYIYIIHSRLKFVKRFFIS